MELENMAEKTSQILSSGIIRKQVLYNSSISSPSSAYEIYEIKNFLDDLPQDDFADVFVYFRRYDRIISAEKSSLSSKEYYDTYYRDAYNNLMESSNNYDAFLSALTPDTLVPHLISLGQEQTTPSLGVVLSMNYSNSKKQGDVTAILVLQPELLENLIQNAMYQNKSSIMIYDNDNNLLVTSESDDLNIDLSKYTGNSDNIYYDTINGEDYILQFFPSEVLNCTYVSLISSKTFWEKLNGLRTISMISIILSMLVSIVLSWMLARRSYSPINSLIHTIRNKSDMQFDFKKKNELDYIKEVIVKTFTENDMLSSRIKNSNNNLFEDFLLHAMQGTLSNNKYFERELEQLQLNFKSNSFCILLVNIDSVNEDIIGPIDSSNGQGILSLIVGNIILELCANSHQGFIINLLPKVYAVVLNYSPNITQDTNQENALEIVHTFQNFIKQHFNIGSTISVSSTVEGIYNINTAYQQALSAMEYRYLIGKGSIIPYQDISIKKFTYNNSFNSKNSLILMSYVKENIHEDISAIINEIIHNSMIDSNSSLSVIECFKYDLINTINKIIYEINAMEPEKKNNYVHCLIHAETFDEFQEVLKSTLIQLKKFWDESKEQFTICDKAEELIHECYMDINLNNSIIADKLNISPSYLSKLFKNQKNISLLDYLYQVRLSYAKRFLRETNLTVEEIASKTGFISNSALTKAFKKYEGITPGSYRRLIM
jgi:AraC-like DNA-binding protein